MMEIPLAPGIYLVVMWVARTITRFPQMPVAALVAVAAVVAVVVVAVVAAVVVVVEQSRKVTSKPVPQIRSHPSHMQSKETTSAVHQ
mmetsp:Transcript_70825/g.196767  ORF Transcript_70825/g.196767 Transcript_70825/m.196767 type:complete len:87 (-) Transcript_70825:106-366(-)